MMRLDPLWDFFIVWGQAKKRKGWISSAPGTVSKWRICWIGKGCINPRAALGLCYLWQHSRAQEDVYKMLEWRLRLDCWWSALAHNCSHRNKLSSLKCWLKVTPHIALPPWEVPVLALLWAATYPSAGRAPSPQDSSQSNRGLDTLGSCQGPPSLHRLCRRFVQGPDPMQPAGLEALHKM